MVTEFGTFMGVFFLMNHEYPSDRKSQDLGTFNTHIFWLSLNLIGQHL